MAAGDVTVFDEFKQQVGEKLHQLDTEVFKCAIITNAVPPTAAFVAPALGSFTQVGTAGSYAAGGKDITSTYSQTGGTATFDGADVSWPQNASNTADAFWGLIYNDTDPLAANKRAVAFVQLGGVGAATAVDMSAGALTITWNGAGIFTLA